jgi:hypothetical protein
VKADPDWAFLRAAPAHCLQRSDNCYPRLRTRLFEDELKREAGGWYPSFSCVVEVEVAQRTGEAVGIDRGVANSVVLSTGEMFHLPVISERHDWETAERREPPAGGLAQSGEGQAQARALPPAPSAAKARCPAQARQSAPRRILRCARRLASHAMPQPMRCSERPPRAAPREPSPCPSMVKPPPPRAAARCQQDRRRPASRRRTACA